MSHMNMAEFFDKKSEVWDEVSHEPREAILRCLELIGGTRDARVLDIGCGTGLMEPYLLAAGASAITAIDLSAGMIGKAKEKYGDDERIAFLVSDVTALEGQERFDIAMLFNVYPHILDKEALMASLRAHLMPGGRFVIAHGKGRAAINKHHETVPHCLSVPLESAQEEAKRWSASFDVDIAIDEDNFYCVSGVLRG